MSGLQKMNISNNMMRLEICALADDDDDDDDGDHYYAFCVIVWMNFSKLV